MALPVNRPVKLPGVACLGGEVKRAGRVVQGDILSVMGRAGMVGVATPSRFVWSGVLTGGADAGRKGCGTGWTRSTHLDRSDRMRRPWPAWTRPRGTGSDADGETRLVLPASCSHRRTGEEPGLGSATLEANHTVYFH